MWQSVTGAGRGSKMVQNNVTYFMGSAISVTERQLMVCKQLVRDLILFDSKMIEVTEKTDRHNWRVSKQRRQSGLKSGGS